MWTPITSLETETFYKSITIVTKNVTFFLRSLTMVIPVIKYIMDFISVTFVCWFNISLFHSVVCFSGRRGAEAAGFVGSSAGPAPGGSEYQ